MRLHLRKREVGQRFATRWVLETDNGHVVTESGEEPFGFSTGAHALTIWAKNNGHTIVGGGVGAEPAFPRRIPIKPVRP